MNTPLIRNLKSLNKLKAGVTEATQNLTHLNANKKSISKETFDMLSAKYNETISNGSRLIKELEKDAELRLAEIEIESSAQDTTLTCQDSMLNENQLLFDRMAVSKSDFSKKKREIEKTIRICKRTKLRFDKERKIIQQLLSAEGSALRNEGIQDLILNKAYALADAVGATFENARDGIFPWFSLKLFVGIIISVLVLCLAALALHGLFEDTIIPTKVSASSSSNDYEGYTFRAANAIDGDTATAWSEGAYSNGIGEELYFNFGETKRIDSIKIINGFAKEDPRFGDLYYLNGRVKSVELIFDDGRETIFDIKDGKKRFQKFKLSRKYYTTSVTLRIKDIYEGSKWKDTCISEVAFAGDNLNAAGSSDLDDKWKLVGGSNISDDIRTADGKPGIIINIDGNRAEICIERPSSDRDGVREMKLTVDVNRIDKSIKLFGDDFTYSIKKDILELRHGYRTLLFERM